MNLFAALVERSIDAEIRGVRARHALRLAAEHARRKAAIDAEIVATREARVSASRAKALVRELVES